MPIETHKVKVRRGELPDDWMGVDWWDQEQWDRWYAYVDRLKATGNYLKEEEITITFNTEDFEPFFAPVKFPNTIGKMAIFVPQVVNPQTGKPFVEILGRKPDIDFDRDPFEIK